MSERLTHPDPGRLDGALLRHRELLVLRWLCEQYAARLDHLQVLTGRSLATVERLVGSLHSWGYVRTWRILVDEPAWVIPTHAGLRKWGLLYCAIDPRSTHLPHLAAMNEVRLHIQAHAPESVWVSRRQLMHGHPKGVCVPHGLVLLEGHETAIEVQLDPEPLPNIRARLQRLERRFEVVFYFCAPTPHRQLTNLKEKGRAPKLQVRKLSDLNRGVPVRRA